MARDEESNGNGNSNGGKSGRQDSSLSARRARLRSLAKQALPPDPYSKKQDQSDPSAALDLDKAQAQVEPEPVPQPPSNPPIAQEPWQDPGHSTQVAQDPNNMPDPTDYLASLGHQMAPEPQNLLAPEPPPSGFNFGDPLAQPPGLPPSFDGFMQGPSSQEPPAFISQMPVNPGEDPSANQVSSFTSNPPSPANPFQFVPQEPAYAHNRELHTSTSTLDIDYGEAEDESPPAPTVSESAPEPIIEIVPEPQPVPEPVPEPVNEVSSEVPWTVAPPQVEEDSAQSTAIAEQEQPPEEKEIEPVAKEQTPPPKKGRRRKNDDAEGDNDSDKEDAKAKSQAWTDDGDDPDELARKEREKAENARIASSWHADPQEESNGESASEEITSKEVVETAPSMTSSAKGNDVPPTINQPQPKDNTQIVAVELLSKSQAEALELLTNIDQALGICAMNLSGLQTAASEQTDVLRNLKETLQNQTFFELGLNLNTLMESMSAALEPMKAVGELVPAIDQLVSTMVAREDQEKETRLTPERLVTALADQLGAGQIDPWTFKCAYMAVFPNEHPADLLHRLVDLLGTQRLSGELFRAAYDAVQAAEPPRGDGTGGGVREIVKVVQDEAIVKQLEELKSAHEEIKRSSEEMKRSHDDIKRSNEDLQRANDELKTLLDDKDSDLGRRFDEREREFGRRMEEREGELNRRIEEREAEYAELLASKEQEIQETQEMLHSRFEEFNTRYEEMVETVNQRDEELKVKDDDLMRRDSEITQLKAQLDELKEQYKDTVDNLQRQLSSTQKIAQEAQAATSQQQPISKPEDKPKPTNNSFFEPDSSKVTAFGGGGSGADTGSGRALFQQQVDTFNSMSKLPSQPKDTGSGPQPSPFGGAPPTPGAPTSASISDTAPKFGGGAPPTTPLAEPSNQAVPKPPQPTPGMPSLSGSGSYGSGVRAQVFEVIVRQALAGAPWREICAGPMSVNNISPDEVEQEVKRREQLLKK